MGKGITSFTGKIGMSSDCCEGVIFFSGQWQGSSIQVEWI
jgi:hypothetical protein